MAALAHHGFVSFGKAFDIASETGQFGRAADLGVGRLLHAERDILGDRCAEQKSLLRDKADLAPQLRRIEVAQIDPIQI